MTNGGISGIGMKKPRLRRDWRLAREKVDREAACRACGAVGHLEAAHILNRRYDIGGANERNILVLPDRIVPLCRRCHEKDHRGELEWLPLLSRAEQVQAVADVGLEGAMQRLSPGYNPRRNPIVEDVLSSASRRDRDQFEADAEQQAAEMDRELDR